MCTYNGEAHLREQLDSIVAQSYTDIEIVIQDDLSVDQTISIIKEYQGKYPDKVRLFQNKKRLGYNRNFYSAYQKATGKLIASADQDDIWETNKIETLVNEIGDDMFIFHNSVLFNQENPDMGLLHKKNWGLHPHPLSILVNPKAYGHQILFRQEALPLIQSFETYNVSYDSLVYTLCSSIGTVKYIQSVLVHWRRHESATTYTHKKTNKNKLYGYYTALKALNDSQKRQVTRDYFRLCQNIEFQFKDCNKVAQHMSIGSLFEIGRACLICVKHRKELFPNKEKSVPRSLKSFFLPLFFIRDYGQGIVRSAT